MSELVVSAFTPALGSGQGLRTYGIVRALCARGTVDLLYTEFGAPEPGPEFQRIPSLTLHAVRPTRGVRRLVSYLHARAAGVPGGFARGASPELAACAEKLAGESGRGRVIADGPVAMAALLALADRRPIVYNAHNLESGFRHRIRGRDSTARRPLEAFERRMIERAKESWMASPADVEGARAIVPEATINYVPNVVDVAAIRPVAYPSGECRTLFAGNLTYAPNREALDFLTDQVFPRVWERIPDARLVVTGRGRDGERRGDSRIERVGFVPDIAAVYARADCVAVPLFASGGSPLKFIEALAYGVPVVATPAAAAGLEVTAGEDYLEAADADAFAAEVARALGGEASAVRDRGRRVAERTYSIESLTERLAA